MKIYSKSTAFLLIFILSVVSLSSDSAIARKASVFSKNAGEVIEDSTDREKKMVKLQEQMVKSLTETKEGQDDLLKKIDLLITAIEKQNKILAQQNKEIKTLNKSTVSRSAVKPSSTKKQEVINDTIRKINQR